MPAQQQDKQDKQDKDREKHARQQLKAAIGQHLIHALGRPGDLQSVQVRRLWEEHYRVNVLVGADAASVKVAHSYFVVTDGDGNIVASSPTIRRQYPVALDA